jgi:hypothetical protein
VLWRLGAASRRILTKSTFTGIRGEPLAAFKKTKLEQHLEELFLETPAPGKHCARNAFRHLQGAFALARRAPEMAALQAITAEEEAASAVIHAIRRHKYIGSEQLNPRDHKQKNALYPFFSAIQAVLGNAEQELELRTRLIVEGKRLQIIFKANNIPGDKVARFIPPLHFNISLGDVLHDFANELAGIAALKGAGSIKKYVEQRANKRNQILYASAGGIPWVTDLKGFLSAQRSHVRLHIAVYLLIDPYSEKQQFVQQGVIAFLKMLERLPRSIKFV